MLITNASHLGVFFLRAEDCAENCRKNRLAPSGSCSHSMRKDIAASEALRGSRAKRF